MGSKIMCMMFEVNIAFRSLFVGDVVNQALIKLVLSLDHCCQVYIDLGIYLPL